MAARGWARGRRAPWRAVVATAVAVAVVMPSAHARAAVVEPGPAEAETAPTETETGWGAEDELPPAAAAPAPVPVAVAPAVPPPPSPEVVELRDRQRKAERLAIGGYVVTGLGALVCIAALPLLISARIEARKKENFLQEAGDPEKARAQRRVGLGMVGAGLGLAVAGGVMIGVGLSRKKRHTREIEALSRPVAAATLVPFAGRDVGGLALQGRF